MPEILDITTMISTLVAQAPLVAILLLVILLYMERRFSDIKLTIKELGRSVNSLITFNEALLYIFHSKGMVTDTEYRGLQALLDSMRSLISSKYYTEEVAKRLAELLRIDINDYTWEYIFELQRIADLMMKEARETDREDLVRYVGWLRVFIALLQARLISKGIMPPRRPSP